MNISIGFDLVVCVYKILIGKGSQESGESLALLDYHTDGQRTVWVKSYTRWVPADLIVMKKEAPDILIFLSQAIDHNRLDVLEQLLPDYYRYREGAKQFANDIKNLNY